MNTNSDRTQLVTFGVGKELYGIGIQEIQVVLHAQSITAMPNAPEFIEGVISIRDSVIPIVDLHKRLNVDGDINGKKHFVILERETKPLGLIVDDIDQVLNLEPSNFEPIPDAISDSYSDQCIAKLAKLNGNLIIVLDPEFILSRTEEDELSHLDTEMPEGS